MKAALRPTSPQGAGAKPAQPKQCSNVGAMCGAENAAMRTTLNRRQWCGVHVALLAGLHRPVNAANDIAAKDIAANDTAAAPPLDGAWSDSRRHRAVPWRLRLPRQPGPWPLVLYSHGLGGNREGGAVWGQAWADAGVAVLHLQHPGSDSDTLRNGLAALRAAASAEQLWARVQDVRFALDEIERQARAGAEPWSLLRLDAIGLAGHSFGAQTTQALAGQRYPVATDGADPRLRAFIALSPSLPRNGSLTPVQSLGAITRPFMAVTGALDGDPLGRNDGTFDGGASRARVFDGLPPGQRALLWLEGADHMSFGGGASRRAPSIGPFRRHGQAATLEPVHQALVARVSTLWWRTHLLADADARAALRQPQGLAEQDRFMID